MDLVRNLPATEAAALARPAVDLASGAHMSEPALGALRTLTFALLEDAACRTAPATTLELSVRPRSDAVRLEVRWSDPGSNEPGPSGDPVRVEPAEADVRRLADRCGLSHRHDRYCLWAEKRTTFREPRSA